MDRRSFVGITGAATAARLSLLSAGAAEPGEAREWYELRIYRISDAGGAETVDTFFREAAIPAMNRLGLSPVGAFRASDDPAGKGRPIELGEHDLVVLVPHPTADSIASLAERLQADPQYMRAGIAVHDAPTKEPVYARIESWVMKAFTHIPRVERPTEAPGRFFQLRIYESHNQRAALKKMEMFNEGGELRVFRECGMNPVFFGQSVAGTRLPNLIYMLGFPDAETQDQAWERFQQHPDWQALRSDAQYKGTVSTITNTILRPTAYSQL